MIYIENLDKLSADGFKQPANSPTASAPNNITYAQLRYDTFESPDIIQGSFISGSNSTVKFTIADALLNKLFKLYTSTDGVTYTENTTFSDTSGKNLIAPAYLDAADFNEGDYIKVVGGAFTGDPAPSSSGVDYLYCRGRLIQENTINSGKAYFGTMAVNSDTGAWETPGNLTPEQTIADSFSTTRSEKLSTGFYVLQFRSDVGGGTADGFVSQIQDLGSSATYIVENTVYQVWKKVTPTYDGGLEQWSAVISNEFVGTLVLCPDEDEAGINAHSFGVGSLHIKTYDANGDLADNILTAGITVEFKMYPAMAGV